MNVTPCAPSIPSPCIRRCCLNERDVCVGCFRTLREIRAWSQSDDRRRAEILALCAHRKEKRKTHFS